MSRTFSDRYGPRAVVAGAAMGIGAAFAEALAARGVDLTLLDIDLTALDVLASNLRRRVDVETFEIDLAADDLADRLQEILHGRDVGLGIYNAARNRVGPFLEGSLERKLEMLRVNCAGPLIFSDVLGRSLVARGSGGLILMSSLSALQGSPGVATYAATKAFNLVLAESLWAELRGAGVDVLAVTPGPTDTPGYEASGVRPGTSPPVQTPRAVAEEALEELGYGPTHAPGAFNRMASRAMRLLPRGRAVRLVHGRMRKMYGLD